MLRKHFEMKNKDEYGFTLIELLVVIIIIGILAAIAIPAFLNQRQRANDSAVTSDVRNVTMQIETALVEKPNATGFASSAGTATNSVRVTLSGGTGTVVTPDISLTEGVTIVVRSASGASTGPGYVVGGYHSNGKQYTGTGSALVYASATGKSARLAIPAAVPAP